MILIPRMTKTWNLLHCYTPFSLTQSKQNLKLIFKKHHSCCLLPKNYTHTRKTSLIAIKTKWHKQTPKWQMRKLSPTAFLPSRLADGNCNVSRQPKQLNHMKHTTKHRKIIMLPVTEATNLLMESQHWDFQKLLFLV